MTTTHKMKFFVKDFLSKCDQIHRKLWIWSHLLKKSLMEDFIFCARDDLVNPKTLICFTSMKESLSVVGKLYLAFNRSFVARHLHRNVLFTMFYLRIVILQNTDRYQKKKKKIETSYRLKHAQVLHFCILFLYRLILMTANNASNLYTSQES